MAISERWLGGVSKSGNWDWDWVVFKESFWMVWQGLRVAIRLDRFVHGGLMRMRPRSE